MEKIDKKIKNKNSISWPQVRRNAHSFIQQNDIARDQCITGKFNLSALRKGNKPEKSENQIRTVRKPD